MRFNSLVDWLSWQETQHHTLIDLGLERVSAVLQRMGLTQPPHTVITVAGTNGKGSCVALLESIYRAAGYRTGSYSSPHLLRYNERIRVLGVEVDDARLCAAFERVDAARNDTSLSYFEWGTLAAFYILHDAKLDVAILEVGLGGRLDAVNILDPDVAVVTSIGIDHVEWLGPDRESIGREKAGIFRAGRPAVCGDPAPPHSLQARAEQLAAPFYRLQVDFGAQVNDDSWSWWGGSAGTTGYERLPFPALQGAFQLQNAATAIMAVELLQARLPVSLATIQQGLTTVSLAGRFQVLPGAVTRIFDVAHNPHGAEVLARTLQEYPCTGRTLAVFAMLADKDIAGVVEAMRESVQHWQLAPLATPRAATAEQIMQAVREHSPAATHALSASIGDAWHAALVLARPGDRVVVFGSFYTVAAAMQAAV